MEKKRQANFELLRIIAMLMVIVLHYIIKGNMSQSLSVDGSAENHLWWLVEGFCNVAVNSYVLISGYFMIDARWHVSKLIKLVCQVLFYSVLIGVMMYLLVQVIKPAFIVSAVSKAGIDYSFGLTAWLYIFLPIEYEHYWFATAYVVLYMLSPVLAIAVKELPQKQLKCIIIALLCFFCIPKSINPYLIPTDNYGYDFGWFICLFLIAGYIRQYDIEMFDSRKKAGILYVTSVIVNWGICAVSGAICRATGKLEYYTDMTYAYNYIFVLFSSIAFFYIWKNTDIPEGRFSKIVCAVAPLTFGVYLFHENIGLRLIWPYLLGAHSSRLFPVSLCRMILAVLCVFVTGCLIDFIRMKIFELFEKKILKNNRKK